jgi:hypothetical protein
MWLPETALESADDMPPSIDDKTKGPLVIRGVIGPERGLLERGLTGKTRLFASRTRMRYEVVCGVCEWSVIKGVMTGEPLFEAYIYSVNGQRLGVRSYIAHHFLFF